MSHSTNPALELDTHPEALERQARIFASMSPADKFRIVEEANRTARELAWAGISLRHPEASEEEKSRVLLGLVLGEELACRFFGPTPLDR